MNVFVYVLSKEIVAFGTLVIFCILLVWYLDGKVKKWRLERKVKEMRKS